MPSEWGYPLERKINLINERPIQSTWDIQLSTFCSVVLLFTSCGECNKVDLLSGVFTELYKCLIHNFVSKEFWKNVGYLVHLWLILCQLRVPGMENPLLRWLCQSYTWCLDASLYVSCSFYPNLIPLPSTHNTVVSKKTDFPTWQLAYPE